MAKKDKKEKGSDKDSKSTKKGGKKAAKEKASAESVRAAHSSESRVDGMVVPESDKPLMKTKEFEEELEKLQIELVKMQEWVKATGAKVCVLFEGRDAAGKGGIIKRITERTSPRVFRVIALAAPTEREKSQMYIQRYIPHLPAAGEIVLFDRSWYNRAGVERVMGYATPEQVQEFLEATPAVERAIIHSGIILIKYWLEVSMENQTERFEERRHDYRKIWKLSPMDYESHRRWYDYSRARDDMFKATDLDETPWYVIDSNDQKRGRLNCIAHLLSCIPYEEVPHKTEELPSRQSPGDYVESDHPFRYVPAKY